MTDGPTIDMSPEWTAWALADYEVGWSAFVARTADVDMSGPRTRFLAHVVRGGRILEVGAGAGRDAKAFAAAGHEVTALEPCPRLAAHLRTIGGFRVLEMEAADLMDVDAFDGVWACASLLHLDAPGVEVAVDRIVAALRPDGAAYLSFKHGRGHRFDARGRHFLDMGVAEVVALCDRHGLEVVDAWLSASVIADQVGRGWSNVVARRTVAQPVG